MTKLEIFFRILLTILVVSFTTLIGYGSLSSCLEGLIINIPNIMGLIILSLLIIMTLVMLIGLVWDWFV